MARGTRRGERGLGWGRGGEGEGIPGCRWDHQSRGFQAQLPTEFRKRKVGIPDAPQTRLVSVTLGGFLRVASQKFIDFEGESSKKVEKGRPHYVHMSQISGALNNITQYNTASWACSFRDGA